MWVVLGVPLEDGKLVRLYFYQKCPLFLTLIWLELQPTFFSAISGVASPETPEPSEM